MVPPRGYFLRSTYDWYVCIIRPCACVCANTCIHAHAPLVFPIFACLCKHTRAFPRTDGTQLGARKQHTVSIKFTGTIWHVGGGLSPPRGCSSGGGAGAARWTFEFSAFLTRCVPGVRCQERFVRRGSTHTRALAARSPQSWPTHLWLYLLLVTMVVAHCEKKENLRNLRNLKQFRKFS
jgi:hypothetical protein